MSFKNRIKCRLLWFTSVQFSNDFSSYKEYSKSFDRNKKISIRNEIKRGVSKR
jgi:hypothetical protein